MRQVHKPSFGIAPAPSRSELLSLIDQASAWTDTDRAHTSPVFVAWRMAVATQVYASRAQGYRPPMDIERLYFYAGPWIANASSAANRETFDRDLAQTIAALKLFAENSLTDRAT